MFRRLSTIAVLAGALALASAANGNSKVTPLTLPAPTSHTDSVGPVPPKTVANVCSKKAAIIACVVLCSIDRLNCPVSP
jgi:hypothetical protein